MLSYDNTEPKNRVQAEELLPAMSLKMLQIQIYILVQMKQCVLNINVVRACSLQIQK